MNKRSYRQNCSLAHGSDLLGERWTLLILRELLIQPCRFSELLLYLDGIGTNLLATRLKDLELLGLIEKQIPDSKRSPYQITASGSGVEPVILAMIRFGSVFGTGVDDYIHRDHWDLLAMKAYFRPERCEQALVAQFDSEALTAWVEISPDGFAHGMGKHDYPDLIIDGTVLELQQKFLAAEYENTPPTKMFAECFDIPKHPEQLKTY